MHDQRYERALDSIARMTKQDDERAADDCKTILLTHGHRVGRATLFLHGMSASPRQFVELANDVYKSGDNVLVPRLPKHGYRDRMAEDLRYLRRDHLIASVNEALEIARDLGDSVRVVGFSLGGLLAAWIAQHHAVEQVVAISPFLGIMGLPRIVTPAFSRMLARMPNLFVWWDPIKRENLMPAHGYPRFATHAVAETLALAEDLLTVARARAPLSRITLVSNQRECSVNNGAIRHLAAVWRHYEAAALVEQCSITGLRFSHDIIEPQRIGSQADRSYPFLRELLHA